MLQRIYGTAFADKKALKEHLARIEEAKKRDHRKLGKELDLFSIYDEAGAGLIVYHPKGLWCAAYWKILKYASISSAATTWSKGPQILQARPVGALGSPA